MWHRVISRLEGEITWSKYSAVYDALLLKFPAYRRLLRQVAEEVGEAKRCADLGAGTGNSTVALLEADPKRSVWAIDSNRFMLRRLLKKVGNRFPGRLQVQQENVERLRSFGNQMFDAVTLVNTLYAIDDPSRCLHEVRRVLSDDGRLVLTTPHADTDVPRLLASLRDALEAQGRLEVSLDAYRNVCERHQTLSEQIHQRTIAQTVELIESCGFDIQCCVPAYNDAVILVSARKRSR